MNACKSDEGVGISFKLPITMFHIIQLSWQLLVIKDINKI